MSMFKESCNKLLAKKHLFQNFFENLCTFMLGLC